MKKLSFILVLSFVIISCKDEKKISPGDSTNSGDTEIGVLDTLQYEESVSLEAPVKLRFDKDDSKEEKFEKFVMQVNLANSAFQPEPKNLQLELADIFNPDKFVCDLDNKLKKKLKDKKLNNTEGKGFIPEFIQNQIKDTACYRLDAGINVLLHGFTYFDKDNKESILLYADESPTSKTFNLDKYILNDEQGYPYYLYTLDCSGYLSAALALDFTFGIGDVGVSAKGASNKKASLVVVYGVAKSPLYQAYRDQGEYSKKDKISIENQIKVLASILSKFPEEMHNKISSIKLNENYLIVCASNSGESGFNGEATSSSRAGAGFGVASVKGEVSGGASVNRTSRYKSYRTYTIDENVNGNPTQFSLKDLKDKIIELEKKLTSL